MCRMRFMRLSNIISFIMDKMDVWAYCLLLLIRFHIMLMVHEVDELNRLCVCKVCWTCNNKNRSMIGEQRFSFSFYSAYRTLCTTTAFQSPRQKKGVEVFIFSLMPCRGTNRQHQRQIEIIKKHLKHLKHFVPEPSPSIIIEFSAHCNHRNSTK